MSNEFIPAAEDTVQVQHPSGVKITSDAEEAHFEATSTPVSPVATGEEYKYEVVDNPLKPEDQGKPLALNPNAKTYADVDSRPDLPEYARNRIKELEMHAHTFRRQAETALHRAGTMEAINSHLAEELKATNERAFKASQLGMDAAKQNATTMGDQLESELVTLIQRQAQGEDVSKQMAAVHRKLSNAQAQALLIESIPMSDTAPPLSNETQQYQQYADNQRRMAAQ